MTHTQVQRARTREELRIIFVEESRDRNQLEKVAALCCVWSARGEDGIAWSGGGCADAMDILRITLRIFANFWKDLPLSPRKMRVRLRWRRREAAWRISEGERLDRIRNPVKYRGQ